MVAGRCIHTICPRELGGVMFAHYLPLTFPKSYPRVCIIVLERTPNTELRTLRTLNVRTLNFPNITFWTKIELQTCRTSQKTKQFANIKLCVPRLVWSHNNQTELGTDPNITFWPKTELRTCRTSQKTKQFANIELFVPRLVCSCSKQI